MGERGERRGRGTGGVGEGGWGGGGGERDARSRGGRGGGEDEEEGGGGRRPPKVQETQQQGGKGENQRGVKEKPQEKDHGFGTEDGWVNGNMNVIREEYRWQGVLQAGSSGCVTAAAPA